MRVEIPRRKRIAQLFGALTRNLITPLRAVRPLVPARNLLDGQALERGQDLAQLVGFGVAGGEHLFDFKCCGIQVRCQ